MAPKKASTTTRPKRASQVSPHLPFPRTSLLPLPLSTPKHSYLLYDPIEMFGSRIDPQPTLSFQQRKPSTGLTKKSSSSTKSIPRTLSATSIDLDVDPISRSGSLAAIPQPHAAKEEAEKILAEDKGKSGKNGERRKLDPKDKRWSAAKKHAAKEMGFMQPSKSTLRS